MPKLNVCYWSVADGEYAEMLKVLLHSYQTVGMEEDFHVFADRDIPGAVTHHIDSFDKSYYQFKLAFLQNAVKQLPYDAYIFLDADNFFVRKAPPVDTLVKNSPLHCFLESDCTLPSKRGEWHHSPLPEYVRLMRECGITNERIYTVNAGFFMVKREAIDMVCGLAIDFWKHAALQGYFFTEEPPLAYATMMLCKDPEEHLLCTRRDLWATDWTGNFSHVLPSGQEWLFTDYMDHGSYLVNPDIVHAQKSKEKLIAYAKTI